MIELSAAGLKVENATTERIIARVTRNTELPPPLRHRHFLLVPSSTCAPIPPGFAGYGAFNGPSSTSHQNFVRLPDALAYLDEGDILRLSPDAGQLRVLHRKNSRSNNFLLTERCNSLCLMCSQPPRDIDDSYIVNQIKECIPLIDPGTTEIGFTGGEPTLLGDSFIDLVKLFKNKLPYTALHILTNGRNFKSRSLAESLGSIRHPDLMLGIPLYSDISNIHDFVVQADGAYDETIRGILNLKAAGVRVEVRVVIHQQTFQRLPELARFITRNLTFVDHVALMGLEITGFTKANLEALWIDPWDYRQQLSEAAQTVSRFGIRTSIYNLPLCLVPEPVQRFSVKSISDWKNEYMPECEGCTRVQDCGGFFSSAKIRHSEKIKAFK
jgi:His-Xaa-Ser system radical SAM maturase HxsC